MLLLFVHDSFSDVKGEVSEKSGTVHTYRRPIATLADRSDFFVLGGESVVILVHMHL